MPIDLIREQPVSISAARKTLIPRLSGSPISPATGYRWIRWGVLAGDGCRVRLEAVKLGRVLVTTREAVARFLDELARRSGVQPSSERESQQEISAQLVAAGLLEE